jgi:small subunit ribosomal protein S20
MANTLQSKKRVRQTERRTIQNRDRRSRIRGFVKTVEEAVAAGDSDAAKAAFKAVEPELMRGVTKGILKKATASRKVSRLSAQVKALS